jgi:hypothetical protein
MKNNNVLIGAIAVIGALTLFNTYKVLTNDGGRTIAPSLPQTEVQSNNQGANFPSTLPQNQPNPQMQDLAAQQSIAPAGPTTSINFKQPKKDFGKVLSTSSNSHVFTFTNTGTEPLIISNAKGSCGCTVPKWPKEPIAPGETGEIAVEYKPAGQSGVQTKYVTITANTNPATTQLTVTGDIQPAEAK